MPGEYALVGVPVTQLGLPSRYTAPGDESSGLSSPR